MANQRLFDVRSVAYLLLCALLACTNVTENIVEPQPDASDENRINSDSATEDALRRDSAPKTDKDASLEDADAIAAAGTSSLSSTLFVATDGNDTTGNGSMNAPFATYDKASTVALAGTPTPTTATPWLVVFAPGTYSENIAIQEFVYITSWDASENSLYLTGTLTLGSTYSTYSTATGAGAISNAVINGNITLTFNPGFAQNMEFYGCWVGGALTATGGGTAMSDVFAFSSVFTAAPTTLTDLTFGIYGSSFAGVTLSASSYTATFLSTSASGSVETLILNGPVGHTCIAQNDSTNVGFLTLNGPAATYTGTIDGSIPYEANQPVLTGGAAISQYTILGEIPPTP